MAAVGAAHDQGSRGLPSVMIPHRLIHVEREFEQALARLVIGVLRMVLNRRAVPTLIAGGKGIASGEHDRLERAGAEFCSRESACENRDFAIPIRGQQDLRLRVNSEKTAE